MGVLLLVARGLSNRQIAASLHRSEATIERHIANIGAKSGAQSRTEATRKALSEGWIALRDVTQGNEER
jgi:DNA-binding NarL/FixJ family response regulator